MKRIRWVILFIFVSSTLFSQDKISADEIVANVQQKYSSFTDVSAKYVQRVSLRFGKKEQIQSGTVKIKKGNKFRIESEQQLISTDGKTVWMYSTAQRHVVISAYKKNSTSFSIERILQGLPKDFVPEIEKNSSTECTLVMQPKTKTNFITSIRAVVKKEDSTIQRIDFVDANKTQTTIELSELKWNSGISDGEFIFSIPSGVTVVDSRTFAQ